jgi:hypothetical protein
MVLGSTQPLTEMSTRNLSWGVNAAAAYGWQPATFMCRLSRNLGASSSWNPQGLSRPVMGMLCFTVQCFSVTAIGWLVIFVLQYLSINIYKVLLLYYILSLLLFYFILFIYCAHVRCAHKAYLVTNEGRVLKMQRQFSARGVHINFQFSILCLPVLYLNVHLHTCIFFACLWVRVHVDFVVHEV